MISLKTHKLVSSESDQQGLPKLGKPGLANIKFHLFLKFKWPLSSMRSACTVKLVSSADNYKNYLLSKLVIKVFGQISFNDTGFELSFQQCMVKNYMTKFIRFSVT